MPLRESATEVPPADRSAIDELFACEGEFARPATPELIFTQPADKASAEQFADEPLTAYFLDEEPLTTSPLSEPAPVDQFRPSGELVTEPAGRRGRMFAVCAAIAFAAAGLAGWFVGEREKTSEPPRQVEQAAAPAPAPAAPPPASNRTTAAPFAPVAETALFPVTDVAGRNPPDVKEVATTMTRPAPAELHRRSPVTENPVASPAGPRTTELPSAAPLTTSAAVSAALTAPPDVPVNSGLAVRDEPPGDAAPVAVPPVPAAPAPTPSIGPAAVDERARVRATLARYEVAYSELDAVAAARVYPGIDQRALARAFGALDSQQILLRDCRIDVQQSRARAVCDGTATWTPKVGGKAQEAARRWEFELQQQAASWQIGNVRIR